MVLKREIGRDREDEREARDDGDEVEVAQQVVGQGLVRGRDDGLPAGHEIEHAAVWLQSRDLRCRQPLGRARLGLDHDLRADDLGQRRREVPGDGVGVRAGVVAMDQPDRSGRQGLGPHDGWVRPRSLRPRKGSCADVHSSLQSPGHALPDRERLARSCP